MTEAHLARMTMKAWQTEAELIHEAGAHWDDQPQRLPGKMYREIAYYEPGNDWWVWPDGRKTADRKGMVAVSPQRHRRDAKG